MQTRLSIILCLILWMTSVSHAQNAIEGDFEQYKVQLQQARCSDPEEKLSKISAWHLIVNSPKHTLHELCLGAKMSFSNLFSQVTTDIQKTSNENIEKLISNFSEKRNYSNSDILNFQNSASFNKIYKNIRVTHETSMQSASKILNSGSLLSLDELIRRNLVSPAAKVGSASKFDVEGSVGEQDAIFLAIKGPNSIGDTRFGEVEFTFNKSKILQLGYFSFYAFDHSPFKMNLVDANEPDPAHHFSNYVRLAINAYKESIFNGEDALKKLISISLLQMQWDRKNPLTVNDYSKIFRFYSQLPPEVVTNDQYEIMSRNVFVGTEIELRRGNSIYHQVLQAYQRFPNPNLNPSWLLASNLDAYFYELKIPAQLSLESLESITFSKNLVKSEEGKKLIEAINGYAAKSGRSVSFHEKRDPIDSTAMKIIYKFGE